MTRFLPRIVLPAGQRARVVVLFVGVLMCRPALASAQRAGTTGPYVAVDGGRQQVIAGALVDGLDTLQEDVRTVTSLNGGWRVGLARLVVGAELGRGWFDGALERRDAATVVRYEGGSQWHWGLSAGLRLGGATLVYAYLSEVTRAFDVTIAQPGGTVAQQDEQGLLRFGAGVERRLRGPLAVRATAGTSRADFGDRPTNIDPRRRLEASLGLVWRF